MARLMDEQNLLFGSADQCRISTEKTEPNIKMKGNSNRVNVNAMTFLNVIFGKKRFFTTNRGIRREVRKAFVSLYSLKKEGLSGCFLLAFC